MAVKIRLSRKGRKKAPFYHIIVADARSPRDGKFIEKLGTYNPMTKPATIEIDRNAAYDWLVKGAQPTDTVKAILRFKGVYYKKHLMRGVKKGAMSVEQADILWQQWIDEKESKIESRRVQTKSEQEAFRKLVSGEAKAKVIVADESTKEAAHAFKATEDKPTTKEDTSPVEAVIEPTTEVATEEVIEPAEEVTTEEVIEPAAEVTTEEVIETAEEVVTEEVIEPTAEVTTEEVPAMEDTTTGTLDAVEEDDSVAEIDTIDSDASTEKTAETTETATPTEE